MSTSSVSQNFHAIKNLNDTILPEFLKRTIRKPSRISTRRLEELIDAELQGDHDEFQMPQLLEKPIVIKPIVPRRALLPTPEDVHEDFKKEDSKMKYQQRLQQIQKKKSYNQKSQGVQMQYQQQPSHYAVQYQVPLVPQLIGTEYGWFNGALVPVHHHIALVPHYSI